MYTLYYLPDACSLATQVILHELEQPVEIINKNQVHQFEKMNPVGTVPVLVNSNETLREGAAVIIYLLEKHSSHLLPENDSKERHEAIQNIMFANATMHPAYGRLFFAMQTIDDEDARQIFFNAAADAISALWQVVEDQLIHQPYLGGQQISAADIMLAVYSRWGATFPVTISIGEKTMRMLETVIAMPNFQRALQAELVQSAA